MAMPDGDVRIPWSEAIFMDIADFPRIADLANVADGGRLQLADVVGDSAGVSLVRSWVDAFLARVDYKCAKYGRDSTAFFFRSNQDDRAVYALFFSRDATVLPTFSQMDNSLRRGRRFSRAWTDAIIAAHGLCFVDVDADYCWLECIDNGDGSMGYLWYEDMTSGVWYSLRVGIDDRPILWWHWGEHDILAPQHLANFHARHLHSWVVPNEPIEFCDLQLRADALQAEHVAGNGARA